MVNEVTLIGYVTRDPETRELDDGRNVASFGIATHRVFRSPDGTRVDQTEFHECVAWGKVAVSIASIVSKGRLAYIRGSLKTDHWESEGVRRQQTRIVVDEYRVLDRPKQPDESATPIASASSPA